MCLPPFHTRQPLHLNSAQLLWVGTRRHFPCFFFTGQSGSTDLDGLRVIFLRRTSPHTTKVASLRWCRSVHPQRLRVTTWWWNLPNHLALRVRHEQVPRYLSIYLLEYLVHLTRCNALYLGI